MKFELFSEVYNCYFLVVRRILEAAADIPLTEKELSSLATEYGYEETALTVVPKLIGSEKASPLRPEECGEWNLLSAIEGRFHSKVKRPQRTPNRFFPGRTSASLTGMTTVIHLSQPCTAAMFRLCLVGFTAGKFC